MQVTILEYVVPCVKFDKVSTSKTWLINILPSGFVLTRHIRPSASGWICADQAGHIRFQGRTYPVSWDYFTLLSVDFSWVPHWDFTSCFWHSCLVLTRVLYSFLKAMARGNERRSNHHQDVGASSSGPSAKPMKLAKRPRPSSYQEESSPEASPPCGGTPDDT
jgi:hypothetical protein